MSKIKDIENDVPEQTVEEFLAVMDANERGYSVNFTQPNTMMLDIISTLNQLINSGTVSEDIAAAANEKILAAINNIKIEEPQQEI
jgi:hypothetical protein